MKCSAQFILIFLWLISLFGCGGSTRNIQNSDPPPPPGVSIAFAPVPPAAIALDQTAQFTAVVSNDPNNGGVDWSLTCQSNCGSQSCVTSGYPCGTLSAQHTASGQSVTYTPSTSFTGNNMSVNIVAFATDNHAVNVVGPLAVTAFAGILKGTYIFQAKGSDANAQPYQITGALVLDGNGNVLSGQQTLNTVSGMSQTTPIASGSTYFVGSDGRGAMSLNTNQSGNQVTETLSLVVLSSSGGMIAELDSNSAAGTLELQNSSEAVQLPGAGYAFVASGSDYSGTPTAFGGVLNINSPGNISGEGSLADQDYNNTFHSCSSPKGLTGTVLQPGSNPFGVVTFTLNGPDCFGSITLLGYIVDSTHIRIIETDDTSGGSGFLTAGIAVGQGSATGTFSAPMLSGPYVAGILGMDLTSLEPSSLTSLSEFSADGNGNITSGYTDTFMIEDEVSQTPYQLSADLSGTYQVDTKGIGRVRASLKYNPSSSFNPDIVLYLTGSGTPPLVLFAGGEQKRYPCLGTGVARPQAANAQSLSLSGEYGLAFTQQNGSENDGSGQATASAGSLAGLVSDTSNGFGNTVSLSGAFTSPDSFGRASGTFGLLGASTTAVEYYLIDANHAYFVETDLITQLSGQVALGYFSTRTPVCTSCP
jgi:hypothetical protein